VTPNGWVGSICEGKTRVQKAQLFLLDVLLPSLLLNIKKNVISLKIISSFSPLECKQKAGEKKSNSALAPLSNNSRRHLLFQNIFSWKREIRGSRQFWLKEDKFYLQSFIWMWCNISRALHQTYLYLGWYLRLQFTFWTQ
jgi:hypothetical protein